MPDPRDLERTLMAGRLRILTLLVALVLAALAARAQSDDIPVAKALHPRSLPAGGDGGHGWLALPGQPGLGFPALYHLPPGEEPGTVRAGPRLVDFPQAIAAAGERVVIVMPPERIDPSGGSDASPTPAAEGEVPVAGRNDPPARLIRRVQRISVARASAGGLWEYRPRGRGPIAMPSLPGRGDLRGAVINRHAVFALLQGTPSSDTETGFDGPREDLLSVLPEGALEWHRAPLPADWVAEAPGAIVALGARIVLFQNGRSWEAQAGTLKDPSSAAEDPWTPGALSADLTGAQVVAAGSSLVVARGEPQRVTLELVRDDSRAPLGAVEHAVTEFAVIGGGDLLTVVWRGEEDPARLHATVVSAVSGAVLYDGFARTNAVVSGREIQSLALLVGALMLTILVFVLRPEDALSGAVVIPEGYALASPMRRMGAVLLDLAPMLTLCAFLFGVSGRELLDAAVLSDDSTTRGAAALGLAFVLTALHSAIGEWLFGRTIGKAALRCRTISVKGERPRLWQAAIRTFVKLLFPPFALFLFLDIRRRHPGDLVAGTAVLQRHAGLPADGADPPEGDSGRDSSS